MTLGGKKNRIQMVSFGLILKYINHYGLLNAKSCLYRYLDIYVLYRGKEKILSGIELIIY